jgi:SAM-dependent methyltransferase
MSQIAQWEVSSLNLELLFCTDVLRLRSLHYGYWEVKEELDLKRMREAQDRYTETLLHIIPESVEAILDVGCGVGDVASALAQKGHTVTAVSPDRNHAQFFADRNGGRLSFHNVKFEDFDSDQKYDLVLMSESQNYFAMDTGFGQSKKHLGRGGYLLVSGIFKRDGDDRFEGCHIEEEYIRRAESYGFILEKYLDITENVLPTLEFAGQLYKEYLTPSLGVLTRYLENHTRPKVKLLKLLFAKELRHLARALEYYEERFDPGLFQERMRYSRLLFACPEERALTPPVSAPPPPASRR